MPLLSKDSNGNLLLTWISNKQGEAFGSETSPDDIQYAIWDGTKWSQPAMVATGIKGLLSYTQIYGSGGATLVTSQDMDGDSITHEDTELFAYHYKNGTWSVPQRLTNNSLSDDTPRLTWNLTGQSLLIWQQNGILVSTRNLETSNISPLIPNQRQGTVEDLTLVKGNNGQLALVWSDSQKSQIDLFSSLYDPIYDTWGVANPITMDASKEYSVTGTFLSAGELLLLYDKSTINYVTKEIKDENGNSIILPNVPVVIQTDLYVIRHRFTHDLGISQNDIQCIPGNPVPGANAKIQAIIHNLGDFAETNIPVGFYDGDPNNNGLLIGSVHKISGPLLPGATISVETDWKVPLYQGSHQVTISVNPEGAQSEKNPENNQANISVVLPDPKIDSVKAELISGSTWFITAGISNTGSIAAASMELVFKIGGKEGEEIFKFVVEELQADTIQEFSYIYVASPNDDLSNGTIVYAQLLCHGLQPDYDSSNNTAVVSLTSPNSLPPVGVQNWSVWESSQRK